MSPHDCHRCTCSPCRCPAPAGDGCLPSACAPAPCFFQGQLVTSDDLNALMTYVKTKDRIFARFAGGWGVWTGLRVDAAPGIATQRIGSDTERYSPNPQVLAGTTAVVRAGIAVDAHGRVLSLCSERVVDLAELARQAPSAARTGSCSSWFASRDDVCGPDEFSSITASEHWLVAEYDEVPAHPRPQYAGGGACDPAPGCDFGRRLECVELRLVPSLPRAYFATGCLEDSGLRLPDPPRGGPGESARRPGALVSEQSREQLEYVDRLNEIIGAMCCARPAVVLARVLLTSGNALAPTLSAPAGRAPVYAVIDDAYPWRRPLMTMRSTMTMSAAQGGAT